MKKKVNLEEACILAFRIAEAIYKPNGPYLSPEQIKEEIKHIVESE